MRFDCTWQKLVEKVTEKGDVKKIFKNEVQNSNLFIFIEFHLSQNTCTQSIEHFLFVNHTIKFFKLLLKSLSFFGENSGFVERVC